MKTIKNVTEYYIGIYTQSGWPSDELGPFDTYKEAFEEMQFQKDFMPDYKYWIIQRKGRVLYER